MCEIPWPTLESYVDTGVSIVRVPHPLGRASASLTPFRIWKNSGSEQNDTSKIPGGSEPKASLLNPGVTQHPDEWCPPAPGPVAGHLWSSRGSGSVSPDSRAEQNTGLHDKLPHVQAPSPRAPLASP